MAGIKQLPFKELLQHEHVDLHTLLGQKDAKVYIALFLPSLPEQEIIKATVWTLEEGRGLNKMCTLALTPWTTSQLTIIVYYDLSGH